jgi:hypothetical protein
MAFIGLLDIQGLVLSGGFVLVPVKEFSVQNRNKDFKVDEKNKNFSVHHRDKDFIVDERLKDFPDRID